MVRGAVHKVRGLYNQEPFVQLLGAYVFGRNAELAATGKLNGTHSVTFALAFVMAFIVMYDAAGVRRAAGEQAKVLNKIVHDISTGESRYLDKNLKELIGHTPLQVLAGAVLGILIGALIPVF